MAYHNQQPFFNPCRPWAEADVVLHFNPRFDNHPGYVVLNNYRNSAWGAEEQKYEAPFPRGSTFTLTIMVSRDKYKAPSIPPQQAFPSYCPPPQAFPPQYGAFPTVPFTGHFQGGLQNWKTITITGRIKHNAKRFHVNLQCGSRAGADIALHFSQRFDSHPAYVLLNAYRNSAWGAEKRKYEAPFPRCSTFMLTIIVSPDKFKLIANGSHLMEFNHRIPFGQVDTISVDGGVELASISFQNPMAPYIPPRQTFPAMPRYSPSFVIPYKATIRGGLRAGRNITIQGVVHPDAKRFHVNLSYGSGIALQLNPRFDENTVVCNNQEQGRWGTEERSGGMPFSRGQMFTMIIICESHLYRIIVNGVQAFTFNHRHRNLRHISFLEVDGNLTLTSVTF